MRKPEPRFRRARTGVLAGVTLLLASVSGLPHPVAAAPYAITRWTVDGGGVTALQVGSFTCGGTIGQADAGRLVQGGYVVGGGFWGSQAAAVVGVPDTLDGGPGPIPGAAAPTLALIHPPVPNPLHVSTRIAFELPESRRVDVRIFDIHGGLVRTLVEGLRPAGFHSIGWDTRDDGEHPVGSGIYFVRVRLGTLERTMKLLVLR